MSGKAIIVLVTGVIIIAATVMFNISASSTRIVRNYTDYYMRQNTQNIAQSGVNLAITKLGEERLWRDGFSDLKILDGIADVKVYDTLFDSVPVVAVHSVGESDYGSGRKRRDTSIAYLFWSRMTYPVGIRGLLTLNSQSAINGNIILDGRDHDWDGNLIPSSGIPGIWSTKDTFALESDAAKVGGTNAGIDYVPANPPDSASIATGQTWGPGGYPSSPDSVFGGADSTFPEGTLKAIARSGFAGSQYVTDPKNLSYPLKGVTYVEMPTDGSNNVWSSASIPGEGILVVHNSAGNAQMKNVSAEFKGIIIADDVVHLHGTVYGGIIVFTESLGGNVVGNGSARILYSNEAIVQALRFLVTYGRPSVLAWWE